MLTCTVLSLTVSLSMLRSFRTVNNIPMVLLSCWLTHRPVPSLSPGSLREMPIEVLRLHITNHRLGTTGHHDAFVWWLRGHLRPHTTTTPLRSYARPSSDEEHRDRQPSSATETASPPPVMRSKETLSTIPPTVIVTATAVGTITYVGTTTDTGTGEVMQQP